MTGLDDLLTNVWPSWRSFLLFDSLRGRVGVVVGVAVGLVVGSGVYRY